MDIKQFEERKRGHIRHALLERHQASGLSGLESVHLDHEALPDFDLEEVNLSTSCLGLPLKTPFYIAGMTAGHPDAPALNRVLASHCHARGWAMGVGSQRRDFEMGGMGAGVDQWSQITGDLPELVLFANLGITQIVPREGRGFEQILDSVQNLCESIRAKALVIHLNALQECMQPEGTPYFRGAEIALKNLCSRLNLPVVLKETGCGFSKSTLQRLAQIELGAIDVSGLGGTHWGRIEGGRAEETGHSLHAEAAKTFSTWGQPTAQVVMDAAHTLSGLEIWASGGVRSGLDAAKLIALGAHRVGYAKPALEAALRTLEKSSQDLDDWMRLQEYELKVALFCTGRRTPAILKGTYNGR